MQNPKLTGSENSEQAAEAERKPGPAESQPASSDDGSAGFQSASSGSDLGTAGVPPASTAAGSASRNDSGSASRNDSGSPTEFKSILQQIGDFDSRYVPQELVGSGAMGVVIKAKDIFLECDVAIKILSSAQSNADEMRERFIREMRVLAALDHPNVVKIRSSGNTSKDYPFYVMDFLKGKSLAQMLSENQRLSASLLKQVMPKVLDGLQYLHENKIVHRDLKPSNIVCVNNPDENIVPKLIDFGIAIAQDSSSVRLTKTNVSVGSPAYMSPEQCQGGQVDERSDIYSFGCILYECISGTPPFQGESPLEVMYKQMNSPASALSADTPGGAKLISLTMKCLEKIPESRPASVVDLKRELLSAVEDIDTVRLLKSSSPVARDRGFLWVSLAGFLAVTIILIAVSMNSKRELPDRKVGAVGREAMPNESRSNDKVVKAAMRTARSFISELADKGRPVDLRASMVEKTVDRLLYLQREIPTNKDLAALFWRFSQVLDDLLGELENSNVDAVEKDAFKQEIVSAKIPCLFYLGRWGKDRYPTVISALNELSQYSLKEFGEGSKQEIDALHAAVRLMIANGDFKGASKLLDSCFSKKHYDAVTVFSAQRRVINLGPAQTMPRGRSGQLILELHVEAQGALTKRKDINGIEFCLKYIEGLEKYGQFDVSDVLIPEVRAEIDKFPPSAELDLMKARLLRLEMKNNVGLSKMKRTGNFPRINQKPSTDRVE